MEYRCFLVKYYEREPVGMNRWVEKCQLCESFVEATGVACAIVASETMRLIIIEACY